MNNKLQFLSFDKMAGKHGIILEKLLLEKRLIYGYHLNPKLTSDNRRLKFLDHNDRASLKDHLQKAIDDLMFSLYPYPIHISDKRKRRTMMKLLQFLALNLGKEAGYRQIADFADSDHKTITRYLDRLEKLDVIIKLESFSRNKPLEKSQGKKFYFFDCGIRNALIENFNTSELRIDWDVLWENFVIAEQIKYNSKICLPLATPIYHKLPQGTAQGAAAR